jgi:hypothetical protein
MIGVMLYLDAEDKNKPISMYINSPGGSVTSGFAIFDTMHHVKCDVSTINIGMAASMGEGARKGEVHQGALGPAARRHVLWGLSRRSGGEGEGKVKRYASTINIGMAVSLGEGASGSWRAVYISRESSTRYICSTRCLAARRRVCWGGMKGRDGERNV